MASSASDDFSLALVNLFRIIFSPIFPLMFLTLCGLSYVLTIPFQLPQFLLFAWVAKHALEYSGEHAWAMLVLALFAMSALPLAWLGCREFAVKPTQLVADWVIAILGAVGLGAMTRAWPFDAGNLQMVVFGIALFALWAQIWEALLHTASLIGRIKPKPPGREIVERQKAHGHAQLAGEAEAVALLKKKK